MGMVDRNVRSEWAIESSRAGLIEHSMEDTDGMFHGTFDGVADGTFDETIQWTV